jgi:DNA-binding XRE family transcriptional regulator
MERAAKYEKSRGYGNPVKLDIRAREPLSELSTALAKTWLDTELISDKNESHASGFGQEVETLKAQRQKFLLSQKLIQKSVGVTQNTLNALEKLDLDAAGKALSDEFGKPYKPAPQSGRISGVYRKAIQRPSGKYAVIEKSKEFTLVPWRETMDRNLGKSISGVVKGQTISWTLSKARGQSIS